MQVILDGESATLPDFLIVGAAKSGTTSLYYYLRQHPEIFLPDVKEPQFFCYRDQPLDGAIHPGTGSPLKIVVRDLEKYIALFREARAGQTVGEASTNYLYDHDRVIREIKRLYGESAQNLKVIIVLRNPVERAWSNYLMHKSTEYEPLSFTDATNDAVIAQRLSQRWPMNYDYVGFGRYAKQVQAWISAFPGVKLLFFEDLHTRPIELTREILDFLRVDPTVTVDVGKRYNSTGRPKNRVAAMLTRIIYKPNHFKTVAKRLIPSAAVRYRLRTRLTTLLLARSEMPTADHERLRQVYEGDVRKLEHITGRDLTSWLTRRDIDR